MTMEPAAPTQGGSMEEVAAGHKMVMYAILLNIIALGLTIAVSEVFIFLSLVGAVIAIVGIVRMASGLGYPVVVRVILILLMFVPFLSLLTLLLMSNRAQKALKAAGYEIGFLGARGRPSS